MKPYHYTEYSTVFDFFSDPDLFPVLEWFVTDMLVPNIHDSANVVDVGAGTGLFSAMLLKHLPNLRLTLIEPSAEMMAIAKERLGNQVRYIELTINQALPSLPQQDVFIFQRSLYAIYQHEAHCQALFTAISRKLHAGGRVFIQDFNQKYDVPYYKNLILSLKTHSAAERTALMAKYQIFEKILYEFNRQVDAGNFHLFSADELDRLMTEAGFTALFPSVDSMYGYQKK